MELDVHVIHYLVISTIMMFCGIYGFFTRKNLLALLISSFFQLVRNCYRCGRNSCCYCYYY